MRVPSAAQSTRIATGVPPPSGTRSQSYVPCSNGVKAVHIIGTAVLRRRQTVQLRNDATNSERGSASKIELLPTLF